MNYVIIGGSTAAIACVEAIRTIDKTGAITMISSENHPAYGRPTISYCLMGAIKRENMLYRPLSFYDENAVNLMLGETVTKIDGEGKSVTLLSGKTLRYDKLLVATGSRPFVPPMEGLDKVKNRFSFMTWDDMEALDKALGKDKNVLVIGAGLIGLKCVEGIADRVNSITVVDLADRILPSILDADGAAFVQKGLENKGINFILGDSAASFTEDEATLKSGKKIKFDILVVAVGVRPNTELVKEAGGKVNRGIVVNTKMQTSLRDVYAAGDCAEGFDSSAGADRVLAILPNAYFQGKTAGLNMAGGEGALTNAIPMNAIGFFGTHVLSAGVYEGECISEITDTSYKKLFVKGGCLVGYIFIGEFERAGIYTALVREKTPLDTVDFEMLKQSPSLLAYSRQWRDTKLTKKV